MIWVLAVWTLALSLATLELIVARTRTAEKWREATTCYEAALKAYQTAPKPELKRYPNYPMGV